MFQNKKVTVAQEGIYLVKRYAQGNTCLVIFLYYLEWEKSCLIVVLYIACTNNMI
jgi:hypothetical protein